MSDHSLVRIAPHTVCVQTCALYCRDYYPQPQKPDSLERLVLKALAANIQAWCPWLIQALGPDHVSIVLEELSLDLPLTFCINNIPDGFYWQRRAQTTWPTPEHGMCDVSCHGGSWRRLVLERHVQALLERASPTDELPVWLRAELRDVAPYVTHVKLNELKAGLVNNEPAHLQLAPVLSLLPELKEFHLRCGPRSCHLKFTWSKFTFSKLDAISLGSGLRTCFNLVFLKLCSSHVTDETLSLLLHPNDAASDEENVEVRTTLPNLAYLDLSHNELQQGDELAHFCVARPALKTLRLVNNKIGAGGAEALSLSLMKSGITNLDFSLNALGDEGGVILANNCSRLHELRVAGCALGSDTVRAFVSVLTESQLRFIDLSNNMLTQESGELLLETLNLNNNKKFQLRKMDLRMTGISGEHRKKVDQILTIK